MSAISSGVGQNNRNIAWSQYIHLLSSNPPLSLGLHLLSSNPPLSLGLHLLRSIPPLSLGLHLLRSNPPLSLGLHLLSSIPQHPPSLSRPPFIEQHPLSRAGHPPPGQLFIKQQLLLRAVHPLQDSYLLNGNFSPGQPTPSRTTSPCEWRVNSGPHTVSARTTEHLSGPRLLSSDSHLPAQLPGGD